VAASDALQAVLVLPGRTLQFIDKTGASVRMTHHIRTTCRLCSGPLRTILELEPTPPANALLRSETEVYGYWNGYDSIPKKYEPLFPLSLAECFDCGHFQLPVVVDPKLLFTDYSYTSGTSPVFREHLAKLARTVSFDLFPGDLVVEIGSNDGTLLSEFDPGVRVMGVDPAANLDAPGILTHHTFFTPEVARQIIRSSGHARLVLALNCLAHIDALGAVADGIRELLADDGRLVMEVAYLPDMLHDGTFDLLYHEHLSFHHLSPLVGFFARHGLCLYDAEHVDSQGGSIRCFVSKRHRKTTDRLDAMLGRERYLVTPEALEKFRARVATTKTELTETLKAIKAQGKTIAAFGCPAKATTLLHEFGIGRETLEYMVEEAPTKIGKFSPGKHVPIVGVEHFREKPPDYCLILAWNFASNIRNRHDWFVEGGGQWILPMPEVKVCE
jgi:hypothetical protein